MAAPSNFTFKHTSAQDKTLKVMCSAAPYGQRSCSFKRQQRYGHRADRTSVGSGSPGTVALSSLPGSLTSAAATAAITTGRGQLPRSDPPFSFQSFLSQSILPMPHHLQGDPRTHQASQMPNRNNNGNYTFQKNKIGHWAQQNPVEDGTELAAPPSSEGTFLPRGYQPIDFVQVCA